MDIHIYILKSKGLYSSLLFFIKTGLGFDANGPDKFEYELNKLNLI